MQNCLGSIRLKIREPLSVEEALSGLFTGHFVQRFGNLYYSTSRQLKDEDPRRNMHVLFRRRELRYIFSSICISRSHKYDRLLPTSSLKGLSLASSTPSNLSRRDTGTVLQSKHSRLCTVQYDIKQTRYNNMNGVVLFFYNDGIR